MCVENNYKEFKCFCYLLTIIPEVFPFLFLISFLKYSILYILRNFGVFLTIKDPFLNVWLEQKEVVLLDFTNRWLLARHYENGSKCTSMYVVVFAYLAT